MVRVTFGSRSMRSLPILIRPECSTPRFPLQVTRISAVDVLQRGTLFLVLDKVTFTVPKNTQVESVYGLLERVDERICLLIRYLLRPEHMAFHDYADGIQLYLICSQIHVINGGNGTSGPLVAIPGVYTGKVSIPAARRTHRSV